MRIIAGKHRGRRLLPPSGPATRPVTDRVKQSVFDIVQPLIEGATVYDCFAGTGSMGLECISRGAKAVNCYEADRSALVLLRQNISALHEEQSCRVIAGDLFRWFETVPAPGGADLIFLDPPYRFLREQPEALLKLAARFAAGHLRPGGTIVFRHDAADALELPPLHRYDTRDYGSMTVEFLTTPIAPATYPDANFLSKSQASE